jgi:signal transduction histidine kinase
MKLYKQFILVPVVPEVYETLASSGYRLYLFILIIIIGTAAIFFMIIKARSRIKEIRLINQELVHAKERAEESERLKSAFLTNMSHELRTPLNAIIGYSGLMIDTGLSPDINSNLKVISNSAFQLLGLVEDILDMSMIETEQIKITKKEVSISTILNELNETFSEEIKKINKNGIKLALKTSPEINEIVIFSDSKKLKQVFIILFKNALKFTTEGFIEFGAEKLEKDDLRYLKFFVKDSGIGIEREKYDVIFNIFRQVDDTHSREYGGMGIGLTIAKRLIEILGGEIWVESEHGKGSDFFFTVPLITEKVE